MTVKADITSTLNGQTAELLLVEDSPDGTRKQQSRSLSGGTEELVFTSLDGGRDKRYTAKVIPSTTDVTQTSEIPYGAEIRIDPIPHRDSDATQKIRDGVEFNNGVAASQLGLGNSPLVSGLLTAALNDGEVLADDGGVHESVQAAQDAASSYIFIGPGTFNESVTIDTPGLEVVGSGYNTLIDGTNIGDAVFSSASNVSIRRLRVNTDADYGVRLSSSNVANNVYAQSSGQSAIYCSGDDCIVNSCTVLPDSASFGIESDGLRALINSCDADGSSYFNQCIVRGDDSIISNSTFFNSGNDGVAGGCNDGIIIGNRIHNAGDDGIFLTSGATDNIVANNRISDSGGSAIRNAGTVSGTLTDGNNTGSAN